MSHQDRTRLDGGVHLLLRDWTEHTMARRDAERKAMWGQLAAPNPVGPERRIAGPDDGRPDV